MSSINNRVQLLGHLGSDPEVKKFDGGKVKATMRIATNDRVKKTDGTWEETTEWHTLTAWGGLATTAEKYLKKGSHLVVQGKLIHRDYTDEKGVKKRFTEVTVKSLEMLDKKNSQAAA